jgi:hypothetical protein
MSNFDFWGTKHAIDDEVARVGWSKEKCIVYIQQRYHARSRLAMTDDQLTAFLAHLRSLPDKQVSTQRLRGRDEKRRRKRI